MLGLSSFFATRPALTPVIYFQFLFFSLSNDPVCWSQYLSMEICWIISASANLQLRLPCVFVYLYLCICWICWICASANCQLRLPSLGVKSNENGAEEEERAWWSLERFKIEQSSTWIDTNFYINSVRSSFFNVWSANKAVAKYCSQFSCSH